MSSLITSLWDQVQTVLYLLSVASVSQQTQGGEFRDKAPPPLPDVFLAPLSSIRQLHSPVSLGNWHQRTEQRRLSEGVGLQLCTPQSVAAKYQQLARWDKVQFTLSPRGKVVKEKKSVWWHLSCVYLRIPKYTVTKGYTARQQCQRSTVTWYPPRVQHLAAACSGDLKLVPQDEPSLPGWLLPVGATLKSLDLKGLVTTKNEGFH